MKGKASVKQRALALCHCGWDPSMLRAQSLAESMCALVLLLQSGFWGAGRGQELHWCHCGSADPHCGFYLGAHSGPSGKPAPGSNAQAQIFRQDVEIELLSPEMEFLHP